MDSLVVSSDVVGAVRSAAECGPAEDDRRERRTDEVLRDLALAPDAMPKGAAGIRTVAAP